MKFSRSAAYTWGQSIYRKHQYFKALDNSHVGRRLSVSFEASNLQLYAAQIIKKNLILKLVVEV